MSRKAFPGIRNLPDLYPHRQRRKLIVPYRIVPPAFAVGDINVAVSLDLYRLFLGEGEAAPDEDHIARVRMRVRRRSPRSRRPS